MTTLKWVVGDAQITQLTETAADAVLQQLLAALPSDLAQHPSLTPHFINEAGQLTGWFQSFLVSVGGQHILIEGGIGNGRERPHFPGMHMLATDFLAQFAAAGITPAEVDWVISSHLHIDHVGWFTQWIDEQWVPTFPNARYLIVQAEYDFWKDRVSNPDQMAAFKEAVAPVVAAGLVDFVDDAHQVNEHLRLIPAPGHSPVHVAIQLDSAGQRVLFSGDVFPHPATILDPTLAFGSDYDPEQAVATRRALLAQLADRDTLLFSPHFADPVAVKVTSAADGYAFTLA